MPTKQPIKIQHFQYLYTLLVLMVSIKMAFDTQTLTVAFSHHLIFTLLVSGSSSYLLFISNLKRLHNSKPTFWPEIRNDNVYLIIF